jgi:IS5 family transposase
MTAMIKLRHQQPSLWHRGLAEDIEGLWEPWMLLVDKLLEDEQLVDTVYEAQGERHPQSRIRGRMQTPAEVVLRLLLLKHIRNWSYDVLEREVRANLVYRAFTRIGDEKVPDAKTLARLGQLVEPKVVEQLHRRVVELAQERGVTQGRKLRVDTTVVESNIHYPTDSSLLGDGTRVLTRTMKKIEPKSGGLKRKVRDRMRSIRKRVLAIALSTRLLGPPGDERRKRQYRELLSLTRKVINQAERVLAEVKQGPRRRRTAVEGLAQWLETMAGRVRQVVRQTRIRIFAGDTKLPGKIVSVFEPHTEIIRKGKASKPNEFGKLVKIQEAENQIVTHLRCLRRDLRIRLCCCPRSRCTNRDWDESRAWWPPMRDFIHARTRKRGKRWECSGCRCPTRKPPVANGNFFSTSVGFVAGKSGEPGRRVESACSNEDTGCDVASIPVWTACDDG